MPLLSNNLNRQVLLYYVKQIRLLFVSAMKQKINCMVEQIMDGIKNARLVDQVVVKLPSLVLVVYLLVSALILVVQFASLVILMGRLALNPVVFKLIRQDMCLLTRFH